MRTNQAYHGHKFKRVPLDITDFSLVEFLAEAKNKAFSVVVHGNEKVNWETDC